MKYFRQVLLILLISCLGELLHHLIPLPIPASIYGMILLFAALGLKVISPDSDPMWADFWYPSCRCCLSRRW